MPSGRQNPFTAADPFGKKTATVLFSLIGSLLLPFFTVQRLEDGAAIVADLLQANPNLTPTQVRSILEQSAIPTVSASGSPDPSIGGAGLIQADAALLELAEFPALFGKARFQRVDKFIDKERAIRRRQLKLNRLKGTPTAASMAQPTRSKPDRRPRGL